jgi:hypothetical protein
MNTGLPGPSALLAFVKMLEPRSDLEVLSIENKLRRDMK